MNKTLLGTVALAVMVACSGRPARRAVTSAVAPVYPPIALSMKVGGEVTVSAQVDRDGRVVTATLVSGNALLEESSLSAAKEWRFAERTRPSTEELLFAYEWFVPGSRFHAQTIFVQPNEVRIRAESVAPPASY
jgi:TonB family protein